ncbi:hypothetical protein LINPERHAP2_LOCUS21174 [Linum perenne]
MILEHYLVVQQWHPSILTALGNLIGRTVRVDFSTQNADRGKFARLAVEIDLNEPLAPVVELDGAWQVVEYESIPVLCFECGKIGHEAESCARRKQDVDNNGGSREASLLSSDAVNPPEVVPSRPSDGYGPWMVVARKQRSWQKFRFKQVVWCEFQNF